MAGTGNAVTRVDQHAAGTVTAKPVSTQADRRPRGDIQRTSGILVTTPCDIARILELIAVCPISSEALIAEADRGRLQEHAACISVAACCTAQRLAESAVSREALFADAIRSVCDEIGRADSVAVTARGGAERLAEGAVPPVPDLTGAAHSLRCSVRHADSVAVAAGVGAQLQRLAGEAVARESRVADAGPGLRGNVGEASGVLAALGLQRARISQRLAESPVSCEALQTGAVHRLRVEVWDAGGVRVALGGRGCRAGVREGGAGEAVPREANVACAHRLVIHHRAHCVGCAVVVAKGTGILTWQGGEVECRVQNGKVLGLTAADVAY